MSECALVGVYVCVIIESVDSISRDERGFH